MKKSSLFLIASLVAMTAAVTVQAATPAAPAAPAAAQPAPPPLVPPTFGAPIPGQCVLDPQAVMLQSKMGMAASDRLTQLAAGVKADLAPENEALVALQTTLQTESKTPKTTPAAQKAWDAKVQDFQKRGSAFEAKQQVDQQRLQYASRMVQQALFQKMLPQVNAVVTQRGCSTVLSADSLLSYSQGGDAQTAPTNFLYANPAMDISRDVVQKLDATGELLPNFNLPDPNQVQGGGQ